MGARLPGVGSRELAAPCVPPLSLARFPAIAAAHMVSDDIRDDLGPQRRPGAALPPARWPWWLPAIAVAAWWLADLRYQWASLPEYRFGPIVVVLTAYLAWERWPTRPREDSPAPFIHVLGLALLGLPWVLLAELWKQGVARAAAPSFALSLGCALILLALALSISGWRTVRHFFFPLLFFFIAVPLPNLLRQPVVLGLQSFVATLNVEVLNLLGIPAVKEGHIITLAKTQVGVDEACAGIRSLQSSIMVALFVGDLVIRQAVWKIFFGLAGVGLAIFGNLVRSLRLSLAAHSGGPEALHAVHDSTGSMVMWVTLIGLGMLAWGVVRLERRANAWQAEQSRSKASAKPSP